MLNFAFIFSKTVCQNVGLNPPINFCDSSKIDKSLPIVARIETRKPLAYRYTSAEYKQIDVSFSDEQDKALLTYDFLYTLEAPFELYNSKQMSTNLKLKFSLRALIELAINTNPDSHLTGNKITSIQLQLSPADDNLITLSEQSDKKRPKDDVWLHRVLEEDQFIDAQLFLWEGKINHIFHYILDQIKTENVFTDFLNSLETSYTDMWVTSFKSRRSDTCVKHNEAMIQPWYRRLFQFKNLQAKM